MSDIEKVRRIEGVLEGLMETCIAWEKFYNDQANQCEGEKDKAVNTAKSIENHRFAKKLEYIINNDIKEKQ